MSSVILLFCWILAVSIITGLGYSKALGSAHSYNETLAFELADFSGIAYCKTIEKWDCGICKKYPDIEAQRFIRADLSYTIALDELACLVVVAFQGTDPLRLSNYVDDFEILQTEYNRCKGCSVHEGFYNSYLTLTSDLQGNLKTILTQHSAINEVMFTGHSLGGSLAVLAAIDFKLNASSSHSSVQLQVYTFGQPRLGNQLFASFLDTQFEGRLFRVTHDRDPIPHLPLPFMTVSNVRSLTTSRTVSNNTFGFEAQEQLPSQATKLAHSSEPQKILNPRYVHHSQEIFYSHSSSDSRGGSYKECEGGEDPNCAARQPFNLAFLPQHWFYLDTNFATAWALCI